MSSKRSKVDERAGSGEGASRATRESMEGRREPKLSTRETGRRKSERVLTPKPKEMEGPQLRALPLT